MNSEFKIIVEDVDGTADQLVKDRYVELFYKTYPYMYRHFVEGNYPCTKEVTVKLGKEFYAPACTDAVSIIWVNSDYANEFVDDMDYLTHELAHIISQYNDVIMPDWCDEGFPDYCRYVYGVHPDGDEWFPDIYRDTQYYNTEREEHKGKDQESARFLIWMNENYGSGVGNKDIYKEITLMITSRKYTREEWDNEVMFPALTGGKTFPELYEEYKKSNYVLDYTENYRRIVSKLAPEIIERGRGFDK